MNANKLSLNYEMYIAAPTEKVWKALTDGALTKRYFYGGRVTSTFKKDAEISYVGDGEFNMLDGKILEVIPEKRLVITFRARWDDKVMKDKPSKVTWDLTPMGEVTKVGLVHDGFDGETATYKQSMDGWGLILSSLKTLLETGRPLNLG